MRKLKILHLLTAVIVGIVGLLSYLAGPFWAHNLHQCGSVHLTQYQAYIETCENNSGFSLFNKQGEFITSATFNEAENHWQLHALMSNKKRLQFEVRGYSEFKDVLIYKECSQSSCGKWQILTSHVFANPIMMLTN